MEYAEDVNLLGGKVNCMKKQREAVIVATRMIRP